MNRTEIIEQLKKVAPLFAKRAAPVFKTNGWTWAHSWPNDSAVPTESEILETVLSLIREVGPSIYNTSTGRIEVLIGETVGTIHIKSYSDGGRRVDWRSCVTCSSEATP
jgi:hypothetical protein